MEFLEVYGGSLVILLLVIFIIDWIENKQEDIMEKKNLDCKVKGCKGKLITVIFAGKVRCECDTCGTIIYQTDRVYKDED